MSPLLGEIWEMIAAIALSEASVSTTIGLSGLNCTKMGAWVKAVLRVSNALVWLGPQVNGVSLHVRQIRGMLKVHAHSASPYQSAVYFIYSTLALNRWLRFRSIKISQVIYLTNLNIYSDFTLFLFLS